MQHRQLLTQVNPAPQLPGLMSNAPGANNMYKILPQQQQPKLGDAFPADLDVTSLALAQQLQGLQQRQQAAQPLLNSNANANQQAAILALLQNNPALAQQLGLGGAARPNNDASTNPVAAAAAAAAAANAAQQARVQQALAANILRANANNHAMKPAGLAAPANGVRLPGQPAAPLAANTVQTAQLAALQRAAAAQVQQLLQQQQQQTAANQQSQLLQAAAALAAQQQQQNAQKQAQQLQAQQMLKAVLERNNSVAMQQQQAAAVGQGGPLNAAALVKQLQLHDALAKQDALARAAQQPPQITPALAELLLRQQAVQQQQQQQELANRTAAAAGAGAAGKGLGGLNAAQLQSLAANPTAQAILRSMAANMQPQQAAAGAPGAAQLQAAASGGLGNLMNGAANDGAANNLATAAPGAVNALLAAQSIMANAKAATPGLNGLPGAQGAHDGGGNNGNKEQRRLALACVALQLARSGVSVEQAIQSGIMGGMSVMDVRFIVECYNAECDRMKAAAANNGTPALPLNGAASLPTANTRPATASVHSSRTHSPATSIAGSHMSLFGLPGPQALGAGAMGAPPAARPQVYSQSVGTAAEITGKSVAAQVQRNAASDTGSPRSRTSANSKGSGGAGTAAALEAAANHFNAFNYGFFGAPSGKEGDSTSAGELLGELEPEGGASRAGSAEDLGNGVTEEQLAWLQSTANAHRARWEGAGHEEEEGRSGEGPWDNNDEIAARLANLDLGSGFM